MILVGETSITIYKCIFNFIRGSELNDMCPEYYYVEIDSITYHQEDRPTMKAVGSDVKKVIAKENLTISTTGSKEITFTQYGPREVYYDETKNYLYIQEVGTGIRGLGTVVRDILRERHPRFQDVRIVGLSNSATDA